MDRQHVRAVYRWVDDENTSFTFDLILVDERIASKNTLFGFKGSLPSSFSPFVLFPDGRIDFGSDWSVADGRYIQTNIRDRPIRRGELMTTKEPDDDGRFKEWTYRCVRLEPA